MYRVYGYPGDGLSGSSARSSIWAETRTKEQLDHQPVLAIVGQQKRVSLAADWLQEVGEYVRTRMAPEQARHLIDRAMRTAISSRTVAVIVVPVAVQHANAEEPPRSHGSVFSSAGLDRPHGVPESEQLRRAADILNAERRVAILIGQAAAGAADEVIETADRLAAGWPRL